MKTIITLALAFAVIQATAQSSPFSEEESIRMAVYDYVEGRNTGDVGRLEKAFLPGATLKGVEADTKALVTTPLSQYLQRQEPGKKQQCVTEVRLLEYVNTVAVAQVILKYPTYSYYDYLVLLKVGGKWIIADKFYTKIESSPSRGVMY